VWHSFSIFVAVIFWLADTNLMTSLLLCVPIGISGAPELFAKGSPFARPGSPFARPAWFLKDESDRAHQGFEALQIVPTLVGPVHLSREAFERAGDCDELVVCEPQHLVGVPVVVHVALAIF
jgi:hypothetical protein